MVPLETKEKIIQSYIDNGYWKKETFGEALRRAAKTWPDNIAVSDGMESITYQEWDKLVDICSHRIHARGVSCSDRVIVQLPNSIEFMVVIFALFRMGAIPIFALPAHRGNEIKSFIEVADPKAYITCEKHLGFDYAQLAKLCTDGTGCATILDKELVNLIDDLEAEKWDIYKDVGDAYDTGVLLVSGGTTGIPKLIPRTHADYLYDADTFSDVCEFDEETVFLAAISAAHNFTFGNPGIVGTMLKGGTSVMADTGSPDEILELIENEEVTITAMVPSLLALCSQVSQWEDFDLDSLNTVLVGGSIVTKETLVEAEENLNCAIRQVFGTAEGVNTICDKDMPVEIMADCQGKVISPADEIEVIDGDGEFLPRGNVGELVLRGPYTILNYYNCPEADENAFMENGFYRTGDMAYIDEHENLHVIGRVKEQINRAGEKIMPIELEKIIMRMDDVTDVAVVGIPDKDLGNKICACIVCQEEITYEELLAAMEEYQVAPYKWPDCIYCLDAMPLTAVGKIDKKKLVELYEE